MNTDIDRCTQTLTSTEAHNKAKRQIQKVRREARRKKLNKG